MKLSPEELEKLKNATNAEDWDNLCDEIKKAHNGSYPDDWYQEVIVKKLAPDTTITILTW